MNEKLLKILRIAAFIFGLALLIESIKQGGMVAEHMLIPLLFFFSFPAFFIIIYLILLFLMFRKYKDMFEKFIAMIFSVVGKMADRGGGDVVDQGDVMMIEEEKVGSYMFLFDEFTQRIKTVFEAMVDDFKKSLLMLKNSTVGMIKIFISMFFSFFLCPLVYFATGFPINWFYLFCSLMLFDFSTDWSIALLKRIVFGAKR